MILHKPGRRIASFGCSFGGKESVGFDAAHGFTNPTSPRYDEEADKASWANIVDFLQQQTKVKVSKSK
jgi:hypothetical protein